MTRVDAINRALVFIEGQLAENLGVDEIARASRISSGKRDGRESYDIGGCLGGSAVLVVRW